MPLVDQFLFSRHEQHHLNVAERLPFCIID